MVTTATNRICV